VESFVIECTTCRARLKVRSRSAAGKIIECPKCGNFVEVTAPPDWQPPDDFIAEDTAEAVHAARVMVNLDRFCRSCGKPVAQNAIACLSCGLDPDDGNAFCPSCGAETHPRAIICIKCGVDLRVAKPAHRADNPDERIVASNPPKDPIFMGFLSFLISGLGQMILGQTMKGFAIILGTIVLAVLTHGVSALITWIASSMDAYLIAKKLKAGKSVGQWEFF
jgi:TM2 domain-containing membrane protein YozV/rRNA maturation protein Nop10